MASISKSLYYLALSFTALGMLSSCGGNSSADNTKNEKPNIIILFADDMGYGDLSGYGSPTIKTPHLDQMASEGMKFTNFYAAAPVCTPSRAGLLTGRLPIRSGLSGARQATFNAFSTLGMPDEEITLPEILKTQGYSTSLVGKWHLGHLPEYLPTRHGFDYFFGLPYSNDMSKVETKWLPDDYPDLCLLENESVVEREPDQALLTARYTEKAQEIIKGRKDEDPFFIYLAYAMPHVPLYASSEFSGKSQAGIYGDSVEEIDWSVQQILETLRQEGIAENTIVLFASDNGPWLEYKEHGGCAGPLRAGKGTTREGGQRVPGIVWWPGHIAPGISGAVSSTMDWFTTLVKISGAELPADREIDGADLRKVWDGTKQVGGDVFFYYSKRTLCAVRKGSWKLQIAGKHRVDGKMRFGALESPELYNLDLDAGERYDKADKNPEKVAELLDLIEEHKKTVKDKASYVDASIEHRR